MQITPSDGNNGLRGKANQSLHYSDPIDENRWELSGGPGNDFILTSPRLNVDAWFFGGTADDLQIGERGNNVLLGESGNNFILGGSGRDLLAGGSGGDLLLGNAGDGIRFQHRAN